jgi:hypothetical protein
MVSPEQAARARIAAVKARNARRFMTQRNIAMAGDGLCEAAAAVAIRQSDCR